MSHLEFRRARCAASLLALALGVGAAGIAPAAAQSAPTAAAAAPEVAANINITPRRVIFDRNKRTEAVYVFNQGNAGVTVDVSLVDNAMLPSGEIVPVARAGEKGADAKAIAGKVQSAKPLVLAAPSRLVLGPGQGKTIRLRALMPEGNINGEFRSHLTVTTVPPADSGLTAEQAAAAQRGELVLRIQSIFGLSIPLIVRPGAVAATASFGAVRPAMEADKPVLDVVVQRGGTNSVYGNIEVRSGKELVGLVRGLAVYPEITERLARVPLMRPLRKGEAVNITFASDEGGSPVPLAKGTFTAP